ncbi:MAG: hypothetical protein HRT87_01205 [Legionellales bacterium]|nr:hypothetical protein [Legionellales bacterium]
MSLEVYINDSMIELSNEKGIGLTFQVGGISNPNQRSGFLSNKFNAPKTQKNNEIIGHLTNINSETNFPYEKIKAKIIQNGIEFMSNGFALIDSVGSSYKIVIYSGNISFFDLIKGKEINDLDLDYLVHDWTVSNVISSFTSNEGYIYPIVDYGKETDLLDNSLLQNADALLPCLFISDVLRRTAESINYTLKGSFLEKDYYTRLVLTPDTFGFTEEEAEENSGFSSFGTPANWIQSNLVQSLLTGSGTQAVFNHVLSFENFSLPDFSGQNYDPNKPLYGKLSFNMFIAIETESLSFSNFPISWTVQILADGVVIKEVVSNVTDSTDWNANSSTGGIQTPLIYLNPNVTYSVNAYAVGQRDATEDYTINFGISDASFRIDVSQNIPFNTQIPMPSFYKAKQDEVFKDLIKMYSLVVQTNEFTQELILTPMDDLSENISIADDWSDKIDPLKKVNTKFRISGYGQTNFLKYGKAEDVPTLKGEGSFDVDDKHLIQTKNIVQLVSAASEKVSRFGNEDVPSVPIQESISQHFESQVSRILLLDKKTKTVNFKNTVNSEIGTATTNVPFAYFDKEGRSDSLGFNSLVAANYNAVRGMLDKTKAITANFNLKEVDVVGFDFTIPIFLDVHTEEYSINGYFAVDKISNFKDGSSTKVDLIRL